MALGTDNAKTVMRLIKKFKSIEILNLCDIIFVHFSGEEVKHIAEKNKLELNTNLSEIIVYLFQKKSPSVDEYEETICKLQLFDVVLHNNATWLGAKLLNPGNGEILDVDIIRRNILRRYKTRGSNAVIYCTLFWKTIWIVIREKYLLRKRVKLCPPIFFSVRNNLTHPYIFFSPVSINREDNLQIVIESLYFNDYEMTEIRGKNVTNLFSIIEYNMNDSNRVEHVSKKNNKVCKWNEKNNCYTLTEDRAEYAADIIGVSRSRSFTVYCDQPWNGPVLESGVSSNFTSSLTFQVNKRGSSVPEMLKGLISQGIVPIPPPVYFIKIPVTPEGFLNI